jgi:hypothetical protein
VAEIKGPYDGLLGNDIDGVLQWYEKRRGAIRNQPLQLRNWAWLLCSLGRRADALPFFDALADIEDHAMFVAGQRLLEAIAGGRSAQAALSATPLGAAERFRAAIAAALAEFDIARRPPDARHIAIAGISFCGSTLMDIILEGLPGVASIGESEWLTRGWQVPFPFGENTRGVQGCNVCGWKCEYLTANFRTALGLNPIDWYFRIADRLKTKILVSSDKNLPKIVRLEPQLRLTALVMFKSPKQAWASNYAKLLNTPEATREGMIKFMDVWKTAYSDIMVKFKPKGGKVFLDFDRFTQSPGPMFRSLVRALDLEFDESALISPAPGHSLGGNSNAIHRVLKTGHRVAIYRLPDPAIPPDHAAWIDGQTDLNDLHAEMQRRCEEDLTQAS